MRPSVIMYVPSLSIAPLNNPLSFMCSSQTLVALTAYVIRFALNIMTILFCNKTRKWEFYFCQLDQFSALHSQGCSYCHSTPPLPQHTAVFLQTMSEWPVFRYGDVVIPIAIPITLSSIGSWFWWCNPSAVHLRLLIRFVHSCTEPILHQLESRTKLLSVLLPCRAKIVGALQASSFYLLDLSCFP